MNIKLHVAVLFSLLIGSFNHLQAQNNNRKKIGSDFIVSGTVKSQATGETLIGATVTVVSKDDSKLEPFVVATNNFGFYSIGLPRGAYSVNISSEGYQIYTQNVTLDRNTRVNVALDPAVSNLSTVVIQTKSYARSLASTQTGVEKLDLKEVAKIPVLFGERDVLKALQTLPGVQPAGDGAAGFYVRGGTNDQNLILLDGATIYNASHFFGFFSIFNSDALKDVTLYKGTAPANYGGRISSVVDIIMNDGNDKQYKVSGGIGILASRILVEGPIVKNKSSFLFSARRSYADLFLKLSPDPSLRNNQIYFYDLNGKIDYQISDKDKLFLSGYYGKDLLSVKDLFGIGWSNASSTLRWNHLFNSKLFLNSSLIYSNFNYDISITSGQTSFKIYSIINDFSLKEDFQYYFTKRTKFYFGGGLVYHQITPNSIKSTGTQGVNSIITPKQNSLEGSVYFSGDTKVNSIFNITYGLRVSSFSIVGKGQFYDLNSDGSIKDTNSFGVGTVAKTYYVPEPRLALSVLLPHQASFKFSYARNAQYIHQVTNSTTSSPTDLWTPTTNNIKPEISDQLSIGYYQNYLNNTLEFNVETYFKYLYNQIDYRNGANLAPTNSIESELLYGVGRAYGIEFLLKKRIGKFTGWISYTLSRTEKRIVGINNGSWYAAKQDRTHDVNIVLIYDINKKWSVSANWIFYTGNAATFPSGKYMVDNNVVFYYTDRNGYRFPNYHRLDLSATVQLNRKPRRFKNELAFGVYNAYGRQNAYIINFRVNPDNPQQTQAVQTALFSFVPFISWNFKY
ncbi:MAG: TonB-dependent receptor [Phycisphaerales bacterium]|nr:TonB-dependent receptor [Phycisphaerales bacterium]